MADLYLDQLDAITSIADGDLLHIETDPTGTAEDNNITWANFKAVVKTYTDTLYAPVTGWVEVSDSWSYASSTTITVPSDATTVYQIGDRIRLKQGGSYKYYVVTAVAATTLTAFGGSDYTVANSAITDIAYSRVIRPYGYPEVFNFTPSWVNVSVGNGTLVAKVALHGRTVRGNVSLTYAAAGATTSITGQIILVFPIGSPTGLAYYTTLGAAACVDASTALYMGETIYGTSSAMELRVIKTDATYATWVATSGTVPFTFGASDSITMEFSYLI